MNGNRYNSRLIEIPCSEYYNVDRQRHIHSGTVSAMIAPENLQTDKNVTKDPTPEFTIDRKESRLDRSGKHYLSEQRFLLNHVLYSNLKTSAILLQLILNF